MNHQTSYSEHMSKDTFREFVKDLALHFGQDKYIEQSNNTNRRFASWYQQVKHIPNEPLEWICNKIKANYNWFPRNLSKTILQYWEQWKNENPQKIIKERNNCDKCKEGWLFAYPLGKNTVKAVACGHCRSRAHQEIWCCTLSELREKGWFPYEDTIPFMPVDKIKQKINEMSGTNF